jgi:hypothetical protein
MMRATLIVLMAFTGLCLLAAPSSAGPGGPLDANGCHFTEAEGYHCHR